MAPFYLPVLMAVLTFFAESAAAQAPAAAVHPAIPLADKAIAEAEAALAEIDQISSADPRSAQEACVRSFSMKELIVGYNSRWEDMFTRSQRSDLAHSLLDYHTCKALADPRTSACMDLSPIQYDGGRLDSECRGRLTSWLFYKAALQGSADAPKQCEKMLQLLSGPFLPNALPKACQIIIRQIGHPQAIYKELLAGGVIREDAVAEFKREGVSSFDFLSGDPSQCGAMKPDSKEVCMERAAFKRALSAKNSGPCGNSPICQVMAGARGDPCGVHLDEVRDIFCGRFRNPALIKRTMIIEAAGTIDRALQHVNGIQPPSRPEYKERFRKITALNQRWRRLAQEAGVNLPSKRR